MKDGIELKIIYLDVNFLEIHARATNGRFAGETDMYVPRSSFADLANTLVGFPNQPQDERSFELGEFNPKAAGGGLRLRFYCLDRLGRAGADIELRNDPHKSGHAEATSFFLALEATAIDEFVTELRNAKLELDASALLRGD